MLAKVGQLSLLELLATEVVVPVAVADEILAGDAADPARRALEAGFGSRAAIAELPDQIVEWSLGAGEASVVAIALGRPGATAVLDDAEARACATTLGVPLIGTLGIVARARVRGLIPSAAAIFAQLRSVGLFVDDELVRAILRGLGEET